MKVWLSTPDDDIDYSGATAPDSHRLLHSEHGSFRALIGPPSTLMEVSLATRLLFLCAASTSTSRRGGFPAPPESLDEQGRRLAGACQVPAGFGAEIVCSPWLAAQETAIAMGLSASTDEALSDLDAGRWSGKTVEDIVATEPDAFAAWLSDPILGAPGGETMVLAQRRIGGWIDTIVGKSTAICAISHPMTIRAALAHCIGFPLDKTLSIDLAPLSRTRLSFNGKWRLQGLEP